MNVDDLPERFRTHVARADNGCLIWTGAKSKDGYGLISIAGRHLAVHRVIYRQVIGDPGTLDVGHVCHDRDVDCPGGPCIHRACCDVDHLAAQTRSENNLGGRLGDVQRARNAAITHCPAGHPYDEANTYYRSDRPAGGRGCRKCRNAARRQHYARTHGHA